MHNFISIHRQEISNRILKSFNADIIEKAPQRIGKFRRERISKNGNLYWDYNSPRSSKLIPGDDIIVSNNQHITKNSKMFMTYTEEMKEELRNII